ncbi:Alpha/Beta hydrolase protein [Ilyonectria destructans]|nr:Alpha/Beta hydrolase protein [Ilyonectria destructans]
MALKRVALACLVLTVAPALASSYKTVTSKFSSNTVRFKSWAADDVSVCHGGAAHHTGWADVGDRHLFFWFHEARNNKKDAPLLIWLQGGPGGSSLHGMLYENGPCLIDGADATKFNPYSWTEHFNVIYLDQPAGVGYSYTDHNKDDSSYPSRVGDSSLDAVAFIRLFYEAFPHLASSDLHLSGESYAGRYVPAFASAILDYNQFLSSTPGTPESSAIIPLRSIMVGNPWISPAAQLPAMYDVSCYEYRERYAPHLDPDDCAKALKLVDRCESAVRACAMGGDDPVLCAQPKELCQDQFTSIFINTTRSIYDRRRRSCASPGNCYPDIKDIISYLGSDDMLNDKLEVLAQSEGRKRSWDMTSEIIQRRFFESGDFYTPTAGYLGKILSHARKTHLAKVQRPIDVLLYVGVTDIICNPEGVYEGLQHVEWDGRTPFRAVPWKELPWNTSSGLRGGRVKAVPNLWLAEIEEAGHMVPYDQPASALNLVEYWLDYLKQPTGIVPNFQDGVALNNGKETQKSLGEEREDL